jgi:uncharacterized protein YukE
MMLGGDPSSMRLLAARFRHEANEVQNLTARVGAALADTTWTGPAADRFRSEWEGTYRGVLARLQESLHGSAGHVDARVTAIEQATG